MKNFAASNLVVTAIMALAVTAAAGQSPEPPPDWLEPDLPPGVDRLCAGPIVPDLPPGVVRASSTASDELPPLPPWCDGTCVIDIAFFYDPEAIGGPEAYRGTSYRFPQSVSELRRIIDESINWTNVAWRRGGLDARLRFVGLEREPRLSGLGLIEAVNDRVGLLDWGVVRARRRYGADLVYAITGTKPDACGRATQRFRYTTVDGAAEYLAVGSIWSPCMGAHLLAHEVGHNLGLDHHIEATFYPPYVPFGRGYRGPAPWGLHGGTIMGAGMFVYSSPEPLYGRVIGNAEVDAVRALRYTIPDASRYSATVVPEAKEDPRGYGCRPSSDQACLSERRFRVRANYSTPAVSRGPATRLETFGLGDSGSLFYFFDSGNPELLVKVVNGCWLNDHWWVFGSAATDLRYEVTVADLASADASLSYAHHGRGVIAGTNGYSTGAGVIADTMALPCGGSSAGASAERGAGKPAPPAAVPEPASVPSLEGGRERSGVAVRAEAHIEVRSGAAAGHRAWRVRARNGSSHPTATDYDCRRNDQSPCLKNWRFGVQSRFKDAGSPYGRLSWASTLPIAGLGDSASLFHFFDSTNPELLVKVVDGCAINGHWWVFGSAATDLEYRVIVNDWATVNRPFPSLRFGRWNSYRHEGGGRIAGSRYTDERLSSVYRTRAGVIADTTAFPCHP